MVTESVSAKNSFDAILNEVPPADRPLVQKARTAIIETLNPAMGNPLNRGKSARIPTQCRFFGKAVDRHRALIALFKAAGGPYRQPEVTIVSWELHVHHQT